MNPCIYMSPFLLYCIVCFVTLCVCVWPFYLPLIEGSV